MQAANASTSTFTTEATESSILPSSTQFSNSTDTSSPTTVTTTTTSSPSFWDDNRTIIIVVICVAIVLLIFFVILMALFIKWKEKRRTEGTYNPSRAEKQQNQKNKLVFSIPLPTPERLI